MKKILGLLAREYPDARCALRHSNPLELLVATVLSAQCTDARVNEVTKALFHKYRSASDYAGAPIATLEADIRPTGFFRSKARSIQAFCAILIEKYGGEVPRTMDQLIALPGVGRKTANLVLAEAFGIPGIVVDTHVGRISRRLGLTAERVPDRIEADLGRALPREEWRAFSLRLIDHGRRICKARKPDCHRCCLARTCPTGVAEI